MVVQEDLVLRQQVGDPFEPFGDGLNVVSEIDCGSYGVFRVDDLVQLVVYVDESVFRQEGSCISFGFWVVPPMYLSLIHI